MALKKGEYIFFIVGCRINKYKGKKFESALDCYKNNLVFNKVSKKWIKRSNVDFNVLHVDYFVRLKVYQNQMIKKKLFPIIKYMKKKITMKKNLDQV